MRRHEVTIEALAARGAGHLPGLFGMRVERLAEGELTMQLTVAPQFLAPNGYLHAATLVALADTCCGYGCLAHLPHGAVNFTTIELKTNFLGTVRDGVIEAQARAAHLGRTTQVWDAEVRHPESGRTLALFRCTQMVLWPRSAAGQSAANG